MDKVTIGTRIRYECSRLGLTLEEFGRKVGVSKQCLSGWEHGRNMPDVIALNTMANGCNLWYRNQRLFTNRTIFQFHSINSSKK